MAVTADDGQTIPDPTIDSVRHGDHGPSEHHHVISGQEGPVDQPSAVGQTDPVTDDHAGIRIGEQRDQSAFAVTDTGRGVGQQQPGRGGDDAVGRIDVRDGVQQPQRIARRLDDVRHAPAVDRYGSAAAGHPVGEGKHQAAVGITQPPQQVRRWGVPDQHDIGHAPVRHRASHRRVGGEPDRFAIGRSDGRHRRGGDVADHGRRRTGRRVVGPETQWRQDGKLTRGRGGDPHRIDHRSVGALAVRIEIIPRQVFEITSVGFG